MANSSSPTLTASSIIGNTTSFVEKIGDLTRASASRRSSTANQMGDPPIKLRAHPAHDDDVLRALEQAVPVAMLDDARSEGWADARQSL